MDKKTIIIGIIILIIVLIGYYYFSKEHFLESIESILESYVYFKIASSVCCSCSLLIIFMALFKVMKRGMWKYHIMKIKGNICQWIK